MAPAAPTLPVPPCHNRSGRGGTIDRDCRALNPQTLVLVLGACVLALFFRLPSLGSRSLASAEQTALAESQGLDPWSEIAEEDQVTAQALRRRIGAAAVARESRFFPLHVGALSVWSARAGSSEWALRLPSALAGGVAVALVAWIALMLAGPLAAASAGLLAALSPVHTLASREAAAGSPLLLVLLLALGLSVRAERETGPGAFAIAHGLALGLLASGPAAFSVIAILQVVWLVSRPERRSAAWTTALVSLAVVAVAAWCGLLRSPLAEGSDLDWVPAVTLPGLLRCGGASFTRIAGLEYHLVAAHARYVAPLTLFVLWLVVLGARALPLRQRWLLVGSLAAPFVVGAILSVTTGTVAPLQAWRMLPGAPFVAILAGVGLASLEGARFRAAAGLATLATGGFLALALSAPPQEASPTHALAREIARCRPPDAVTSVERRLDLFALAAWRVPGPLLLRTVPPPTTGQATIRVEAASTCASGFVSECRSVPPCSPQ